MRNEVRMTAAFGVAIALCKGVDAIDVGRDGNGEVAYLSGGIGEEEAIEMRVEASRFPLQIEFAQREAAFVPDVNVRIVDAGGATVMDLAEMGPILLARLPPGRYTVEAEWQGVVKRQQVDVGSGPTKVRFRW